jgi:ribosomal protein S18 acetylase RimI-like enzyme
MIHFRDATHTDLPLIDKLVNSAYRGDFSKQGWTTEAHLLDGQRTDTGKLSEILNSSGSKILLGFEDANHSQLIACAELKEEENQGLYLGMLTVSPALQARGTGKEMLLEVERIAKTLGAKHIRMTVIEQRPELIAYYERRGYVRTGKQEPFPADTHFGVPKVDGIILVELKKSLSRRQLA